MRARERLRSGFAGRVRHRPVRAVGEAAIVFESLAEDLPLKRQFFELIDKEP